MNHLCVVNPTSPPEAEVDIRDEDFYNLFDYTEFKTTLKGCTCVCMDIPLFIFIHSYKFLKRWHKWVSTLTNSDIALFILRGSPMNN